MKRLYTKLNARRVTLKSACAYAFAVMLLALFASAPVAAQAQQPSKSHQQQQADGRKDSSLDADDDADDEGESESVPREVARPPRMTDPATIMRRARTVYVDSDSIFVKADEVEDSLLKRKEFKAWGMVVTRRRADADLVIEITRKSFTRRFTFSIIDPRTDEVLASGKMRSVILGKKISNKVAEQFANRVKVYRPYP